MDTKKITLNPELFNSRSLVGTNKHRLGMDANISYPTILKYVDRPETVTTFSGDVLIAIMTMGLGYTIEEISDMRLADVFAIAKNGDQS